MNFTYIRTPNLPGSPVQVSGEGRRFSLETGVNAQHSVSAGKLAFTIYRKLTLRCVLCFVLFCGVGLHLKVLALLLHVKSRC